VLINLQSKHVNNDRGLVFLERYFQCMLIIKFASVPVSMINFLALSEMLSSGSIFSHDWICLSATLSYLTERERLEIRSVNSTLCYASIAQSSIVISGRNLKLISLLIRYPKYSSFPY